MSVRRSIALFALLLSLSASPFVAADVPGGFAADAALPSTMNLSNFRTAVADAKAMVDRGDLAAARTRLKDLDKLWDGSMASSTPQTVARWRVIDRAINRNLDRSLLALRAHWPNRAVGDKALTDLVALVDQVSGKVGRRWRSHMTDLVRTALGRPNHYHCCLGMTRTYR